MKTVVLLSGGLDSTAILAAYVGNNECLALGFDYGQVHKHELECAQIIADHYGVKFEVVSLPTLPKANEVVFAGRNFVLISHAIAIAQSRNYDRIVIGCNASDWALFPDCRPEFWRNVGRCAEAYGIEVITPLIYMSKRDVVNAAIRLNAPIEKTWSCYDPHLVNSIYNPCGICVACVTRQSALDAATEDPAHI